VGLAAASNHCVSDTELVERARAGDADAFGELVERHQAAVYQVARAALRSTTEADDVAQETFIAAFRKLGEFRGDAAFKTWLLAIAWNTARMQRRGAWRWLDRFRQAGEADTPLGLRPMPSQEDALISRDLRARVRRTVLSLPPKYRDVLLLATMEDLTTDEMSAVLGIPSGTVKWRLSEGRRQLKAKLTRLGIRDE
jgi:RNA polymerase sigma-70 factor, ECF subfamily